MIANEVRQYKNQLLEYFHVQEIDDDCLQSISTDDESRRGQQLYSTSIARVIYRIDDHVDDEFNVKPTLSFDKSDKESMFVDRNYSNSRIGLESASSNDERQEMSIFLTDGNISMDTITSIPFVSCFKLPSNLIGSIKYK
jgi:hypothetical protein